MWRLSRTALLVLLLGTLVAWPREGAAAGRTVLHVSKVYIQWMRVAGNQPRTIYIGGTYRCPISDGVQDLDATCPAWVLRSTDGGDSWTSLSAAIGGTDPHTDSTFNYNPDAVPQHCSFAVGSFALDPRGLQLALAVTGACDAASSSYRDVLYSPDGGRHWPGLPSDPHVTGGYDAGFSSPAFGLLPPYHLFVVGVGSDGAPIVVDALANGKWTGGFSPGAAPGQTNSDPVTNLVPDPANPAGVFAKMDRQGTGMPDLLAYSADLGKTWRLAQTPRGIKHFSVAADPAISHGLVAAAAGSPADRRYYSSDGGATWSAGTCAGDYNGVCPALTVAGGFGAGASYAILPDGVHAYSAHGAAGPRLKIALPVPPPAILAAGGGNSTGAAVYLLTRGALYRSMERGATWQQLAPPLLPVAQAPSRAPGSLLVKATHHSVAPAFAAIYRRLGVPTLGYPIDEAYSENGVLIQDFERLRLERQAGAIVVAPLGAADIGYGIVPPGRIDEGHAGGAASALTTATQRYFASTKDSIRGDFLRFWQAHGGLAVLGAPITEQFTAPNGDGSGRSYRMQYFQNARIEAHPENRSPAYAIQLGLIGVDSARVRGWLTG